MMKKLTVVLLVLCMLLAALVSCQNGSDNGEATGTQEEEQVGPLTVVNNGEALFIIVYDRKDAALNDKLEATMDTLIKRVKTNTGADMKRQATAAVTYDASAYEILIGNTGYEESIAAAQGLRLDDYNVIRNGNKIVIVGGDNESLIKGINYFTNQVVNAQTKEEDQNTVLFGTEQENQYRKDYTSRDVLINGKDLKDYTIVIPTNYGGAEYETAYKIRHYIRISCGYWLEVERDTKTYENEILIGKTARTTITAEKTEYKVEVTGSTVQILAGCTTAYDGVPNLFFTKLLPKSEITNLSGDTLEQLTKDKDSMLNKTGDFRIIYYNVYGGESPDENTFTNPNLRYNYMANLFVDYDADIVCMSEFNSYPRKPTSLQGHLLKLGYTEVPYDTNGNTPIFYKADKFELLKNGTYVYTNSWDNVQYKGVSKMAIWAIFKDKASGTTFAVIATHLDHRDVEEANTNRNKEANELLNLISNTIRVGEYADIPLIFGGDINSSYYRETQKYGNKGALTTFDNAGFKNVQTTLQGADQTCPYTGYAHFDRDLGYFTKIGNGNDATNRAIDHCYYIGGVTPTQFDVMAHNTARRLSDHLPLVVDFTFAK